MNETNFALLCSLLGGGTTGGLIAVSTGATGLASAAMAVAGVSVVLTVCWLLRLAKELWS